jgi:hypothetical protein
MRPEWWPDDLEVATSSVKVWGLVPPLQHFLVEAALIHATHNGKPLTVTSGADGQHAVGSKHWIWKAVDIRSRELNEPTADEFACQMVYLQSKYKVGIFDERYIGQPHWHVEAA